MVHHRLDPHRGIDRHADRRLRQNIVDIRIRYQNSRVTPGHPVQKPPGRRVCIARMRLDHDGARIIAGDHRLDHLAQRQMAGFAYPPVRL